MSVANDRRRRCRTLAVGLGMLVLAPLPSGAQVVRGVTLTGDSTGVPGVVVLLVDRSGATVARALGDARGAFVLRAPAAGEYSLRTLRLGYRPVATHVVSLRAGQDTSAALRLTPMPVVLDRVVVEARRACRIRTAPGTITALWDAAQAALEGHRATVSNRNYAVRIVTTQRRMSADGASVLNEARQVREGATVRPFGTLAGDSLAKVGYVSVAPVARGAASETIYRGPDAETLLSAEFAGSHCFDVAASPDADQRLVGLTFRPNSARRAAGIVEIEGTLWLDRLTSELRRIEYLYVGLPPESRDRARGTVEYRALPDGGWILQRWAIHMPLLERRTVHTADRSLMRMRREERLVLAGVDVSAGEVQDVQSGGRVVWTTRTASVAGTITAAAATVRLAFIDPAGAATRPVRVGASGGFTIDSLAPGPHLLSVADSGIDPLGLAIDTIRFEIASNSLRTALSLTPPTVHGVLRRLCGPAGRDTSRRAVIGTVRSPAGELLHDVEVRAAFLSRVQQSAGGRLTAKTESRVVRTDARGRFLVCDVSPHSPVQLRASRSASLGTVATIRVDPRMAYAAVTLQLER